MTRAPASNDRLAQWLEITFWISLVLAIAIFLVAASEDYLGDCSYETGYYPEVGAIEWAPLVMMLVGIVQIIVAYGARRGRPTRKYVLGGVLVFVVSLISLFTMAATIAEHACD